MKSCWAFGESWSRLSREDIGIDRVAIRWIVQCLVCQPLQERGRVRVSFTTIELGIADGHGSQERGIVMLGSLHAPNCIPDDLRGIPIKAAAHLGLDVLLHLGRKIDMHCHLDSRL